MSRRPLRGVTLIEMIVTVAILGVLASVTTMAVRRIDAADHDSPAQMIQDSLRRSVAEGRKITIRSSIIGRPAAATVHPDGTATADSGFLVDVLTGAPGRAR